VYLYFYSSEDQTDRQHQTSEDVFWRTRTLLGPRTFWLQIRNLGRKFDVLAKFRCVLGSIVLSRNCHTARLLECFKTLACVVTLHPAISESVSNITLICAFWLAVSSWAMTPWPICWHVLGHSVKQDYEWLRPRSFGETRLRRLNSVLVASIKSTV